MKLRLGHMELMRMGVSQPQMMMQLQLLMKLDTAAKVKWNDGLGTSA